MMKYDAHVHFDCSKKQPYDDLINNLKSSGINKCVLILNSSEEEEIFFKNLEAIREDGVIGTVAGILDIFDEKSLSFFDKIKETGYPFAIKLHPRISNITTADFNEIYRVVKTIDSQIITVDCFVYGPRIENHIGVELAIYLAERLLDRRVVIAHAGGCDLLRAMMLTRPVKNIYYDFSLSCNYLENTSIYKDMINGLKFWTGRVMYGTDYPDISFEESIRVMEKMCEQAGLSKTQVEEVFYSTAELVYERK